MQQYVVLASSFAMAQQVSVNYNHDASFSQYHTYAWGSNNTNAIKNSILAQVAQQDIEAAMQQKGLQKVQENQSPDLSSYRQRRRTRADLVQRVGHARNRRRHGRNQPATERRSHDGCQPVRHEAAVAGVARHRARIR